MVLMLALSVLISGVWMALLGRFRWPNAVPMATVVRAIKMVLTAGSAEKRSSCVVLRLLLRNVCCTVISAGVRKRFMMDMKLEVFSVSSGRPRVLLLEQHSRLAVVSICVELGRLVPVLPMVRTPGRLVNLTRAGAVTLAID